MKHSESLQWLVKCLLFHTTQTLCDSGWRWPFELVNLHYTRFCENYFYVAITNLVRRIAFERTTGTILYKSPENYGLIWIIKSLCYLSVCIMRNSKVCAWWISANFRSNLSLLNYFYANLYKSFSLLRWTNIVWNTIFQMKLVLEQ